MEWIGYLFAAAVVGAVLLAIYERRKGVVMRDDSAERLRRGDRAAYTEAERIRSEGVAYHNPGSGLY